MTTPSTEAYARQSSPQSPHLHYTCPHCGGALDLASLPIPLPGHPALTGDTDTLSVTTRSPTTFVSQQIGALLARWFPISSALGQRAGGASVSPPQSARQLPRWGRSAILMLPLALVLFWLIWQWAAGGTLPGTRSTAGPGSLTPAPTRTPVTPGLLAALTPDQAAVLAIVAQYNLADQQVAATLSLDSIRPLLDPAGPLFQRRSEDLAARRTKGATHTTRLLRWAVGTIAIDSSGTTATILTQETWENQEHGAAGPQMAIIRITYTVRRTDVQAPWRIYDATREIL